MIRFHHLLPTFVVTVGLFGPASAAQGGWVTITNDTKQVLVIQETGGPLNRPIRGKAIKLQPGETYREYQILGGSRNIVIAEAGVPNAPLAQEKLTWDKSDAAFSVKTDGKKIVLTGGAEKKEATAVKK
jgi:hypothetical protein